MSSSTKGRSHGKAAGIPKACYECQSTEHLKIDCPKLSKEKRAPQRRYHSSTQTATSTEDNVAEKMRPSKGKSKLKPIRMPPQPYNLELSSDELANFKEGSIFVLTFAHENGLRPIVTVEDAPQSRAFTDTSACEIIKVSFHERADTQSIHDILFFGVCLGGKCYRYFGCSNSQLKSRKAFLISRTLHEIDELIAKMGDFSEIKSTVKLAKRIGMLFSECNFVCDLDPAETKVIEDIKRGENLLTDGCGYISKVFLKKVAKEVKPLPSVVQIRYRGFKGVLSVKPGLDSSPVKVEFRKSMQKFKSGESLKFGIVETSKPYSFASLNGEIVTLLFELGISKETMQSKLNDYFGFLHGALDDGRRALELLSYHEDREAIDKLMSHGLNAVVAKVQDAVLNEVAKTLNYRQLRRIYIMVPNSRLIFGIAEPESRLKPNEVFVRVTRNGNLETIVGNVMVTRNPCLHPGDIRVFKAVDIREYQHLAECILFSTHENLERSPAADLAGGDLDGDRFCVIFDQALIPQKMFPPGKYIAAKPEAPPSGSTITREDLIKHFANYNNYQVGHIKQLYLKWVESHGATCEQALDLSDLFSSSVDGERVKIPEPLKKPISPLSSRAQNEFIVTVLLDEIKARAKSLIEEVENRKQSEPTAIGSRMLPKALLKAVVYDQSLLPQTLSHFELFRMINNAMQQHVVSAKEGFEMMSLYIDFAFFTNEEKRQAFEWQPQLARIPFNALTQSRVLDSREVETFHLLPQNWKRLYSSEILGPCLSLRLFDCMKEHTRKLVLLRASSHLTIGILVQQELTSGVSWPTNVTYVLATDHQGFIYSSSLAAKQYYIELDEFENRLQIYNADESTFFWMRCLRATQVPDQTAARCEVSIDLTNMKQSGYGRGDLVTKNKVFDVELYVINSNDFVEILHRHSGHAEEVKTVPFPKS